MVEFHWVPAHTNEPDKKDSDEWRDWNGNRWADLLARAGCNQPPLSHGMKDYPLSNIPRGDTSHFYLPIGAKSRKRLRVDENVDKTVKIARVD